MLLYSATLPVTDKLTCKEFMNLVIRWNNESTHAENKISGIVWNGEPEITYGSKKLSLSVREHTSGNIIAVRYRKYDPEGKIWDTDYILNLCDKKISVQLYRSFSEDAMTSNPVYSTPHFLTYLINGGYLKDDGNLPVLRTPHYIDEKDSPLLEKIVTDKSGFKLPVIYVSRTRDNALPLDVSFLASKLKGIAHVVVQNDISSNNAFKDKCNSYNEYSGATGIYFPNSAYKRVRIWYKPGKDQEYKAFDKIVSTVSQFSVSQVIPPEYTWMGINNALLQDNLELQRQGRIAAEQDSIKAQEERDQYIYSFDADLERYEQKITELTKEIDRLQAENQGYRIKFSYQEDVPVIKQGCEPDFFPGEAREMILSILEKELKNTPEGTRKHDIIADIIANNDFVHEMDRRRVFVSNLLKNYKRLTGPLKSDLEDLGLEITEGNHYQIMYYGDNRYYSYLAKTPSDWRGTKNEIAELLNKFF